MRARLPLSSKILFWFFLNFVLLAAVVVVLFNAQFHFDLNWLLDYGGREHVDRLRDLVAGELNTSDPDDWSKVLERYSDAYHLRLTLYDDQGKYLVGPLKELPADLHERFWPSPPPRPALTPAKSGTAVARPSPRPAGRRPWWRGRAYRTLVRTTHPSHYWLFLTMRLDSDMIGGPMHAVLVADDSSFHMGGLIVDLTPWLRLGCGAVAFSVLFWFPLLHGITRSIRKMMHATGRIAEGQFDVRVSLRRRDELGALAESINQMAARLDGLVKGQKRFLGDVAHELCSPLARLQMALGIIEQHAGPEQLPYAKSAAEKAAQIASLVNTLLDFSKATFGPPALHLQSVDLREAAEKAVQSETAEPGQIHVDIPEGLAAFADPELLVRALANLVRNAVRYAPGSEAITLSASADGDTVAIRVADDGPGVPEEELAKIFDAFHRMDASRTRETGGAGLGLAIVKTCVESCGGTVVARNRQPHGLEVAIHFPIRAGSGL